MHIEHKLRAVLFVDHGVSLLDMSGPLQTFETVNELHHDARQGYDTRVVSVAGGLIETACGQRIMTAPISAARELPIDTLIVLGGCAGDDFAVRPDVVSEIAATAPLARRICSLGSGVFLLAAAGQIMRRQVAAHWRYAPALQSRYPGMKIDAKRIFVRDGALWTSAGLVASFDLVLALVEEDYGHTIALAAARQLVMFIKRSGLQPQLSIPLEVQSSSDWRFADLHVWIAAHLNDDLRVARLAEKMCMAPRTFARTYSVRVGRTPARTVEAMRLEAACRELENLSIPIKSVASRVGLLSEQAMQRAFKRVYGLSPSEYRARHYQPAPDQARRAAA
jgi:transcriptional regulator GlxA family with amidase domain